MWKFSQKQYLQLIKSVNAGFIDGVDGYDVEKKNLENVSEQMNL